MPCFRPVDCYRATSGGGIAFNTKAGYADLPLKVPCGRCIGCRLERSRQWAVRCVHEMHSHLVSSFVTLTYAPENTPPGGSLRKSDHQKFIKKLRRARPDLQVSYFLCGEYGDLSARPHYHAILFGVDFPDKRWLKNGRNGDKLYRSAELDKLWSLGFASVGEATFESAAYCARYVMKKVTGPGAREHYRFTDPATGELIDREPEYLAVSLKPAIGKRWISRFQEEVYPDDFVVSRGGKAKPPRYYDKFHESVDPEVMRQVKLDRVSRACTRQQKANNTPERLAVREEVKSAQVRELGRRDP